MYQGRPQLDVQLIEESDDGNTVRMMTLNGVPLVDLTEPQLADYAAMLITDQGNVPWGHAIIGLLTWRYWKRPDPVPRTIISYCTWEALCRGIDAVTNRALTRLYFARSHGGRVTSIMREAIDVPVSPWGVKKPPYGDRIFRWD